MRNEIKNRFIRCVLIILLCGLFHTAAYAVSYDRNTHSGSWGYQPVYNTRATLPKYQFHSTSAYIRPSGTYTPAYSTVSSKPRKVVGTFPNDDTDDEIGVVHPDREEMPIGDTPWIFMLILAAGYITFRTLYQRKMKKTDEANAKP